MKFPPVKMKCKKHRFIFVWFYLTVNHTWRLEMTPRFRRFYINKFVTILISNRLTTFINVKLLKHVLFLLRSTINYNFFYFHAYWTRLRCDTIFDLSYAGGVKYSCFFQIILTRLFRFFSLNNWLLIWHARNDGC